MLYEWTKSLAHFTWVICKKKPSFNVNIGYTMYVTGRRRLVGGAYWNYSHLISLNVYEYLWK